MSGLFPVSTAKEEALFTRMDKLGISEDDLREQFVRGSGSGGQKVNKTSSAVVLKHEKSGYSVRVESSRSRGLNRFRARVALCDILESREQEAKQERAAQQARARRQKAKRSRATQREVVKTKRGRGKTKVLRARVKETHD